jgi:hypothetical protein
LADAFRRVQGEGKKPDEGGNEEGLHQEKRRSEGRLLRQVKASPHLGDAPMLFSIPRSSLSEIIHRSLDAQG